MFDIKPLNASASSAGKLFGQTSEGLLVAEGVTVAWKRSGMPFLRRADAGELLTPGGRRRVAALHAGSPLPTPKAIRAALKHPESSEIRVFEVSPRAGKLMLRVSQVAMALGLVYLAGGVTVGVAVPSALRYVSVYYGGEMSGRDINAAKKVISEYQVLKEHVVDEKTRKFFDDMKATRNAAGKEAQK